MILPNGFNGHDAMGELNQQREAAQRRHLFPAPAAEYSKWVTETLREHNGKYASLAQEHGKFSHAAERAKISLQRLNSLINIKNKARLDYIQEMHRAFVHRNQSIGYLLDRCRKAIDETSINYPLMAQNLNSPLADRHKKIGMQRELGLRLSDLDRDFKRCEEAVAKQKKEHEQLTNAVQGLMHKAKIKLPPKLKEDLDREDKVKEIALQYRNKLLGKPEPKTAAGAAMQKPAALPQVPKVKATNVSGYGALPSLTELEETGASQAAAAAAKEKEEAEIMKQAEPPKETFDVKFAAASAVAGAIVGLLLMYYFNANE